MQVGSGYRVVHGIICERVLVNYLAIATSTGESKLFLCFLGHTLHD